MNELTMIEDLRPEVRPLTRTQVDALRAHLFDGVGLPDLGTLGVQDRLEDGLLVGGSGAHDLHEPPRANPGARRRQHPAWLLGAAAAVVVLGVAGIWTLSSSRSTDPPGPAQQPGGGANPAPVTDPAAGSAAVGLFPYGGRDAAIGAGYRTPTDAATAYLAEITDPSRLPSDYTVTATIAETDSEISTDADHASVRVFLETVDDSGDGAVNVQRVGNDPDVWQVTSAVVIPGELADVSLRTGVVTGTISPRAGGTTTLYAYDLATGDTLDETTLTTLEASDEVQVSPAPFALHVGDHDAVGLRYWNTVAPAGAYAFANFADQAVTASAAISDEAAISPNTSPPDPAQLDPAPVPADRLLYPTAVAAGGAPALTIAELVEGPRAMVQAPDGTLYRVAASEQGGYVPDPAADTHDVGDHRVVADTDGHSVSYSWADGCVVTSITTEADGSTWTPEQVALLDSFTVAAGAVDLDLPNGWNVIDHGSNAPLVQVAYTVELDGVEHAVVLAQSLGASIAALGSPMGPMQPVTLADGTPAWFEPDSLPFPRLTFTREGVAVWMWGEGLNADDMIAAATLLAPAPGIWSSLLTDGVEIEPTGTVSPGGQPDLCGTPTLSITP